MSNFGQLALGFVVTSIIIIVVYYIIKTNKDSKKAPPTILNNTVEIKENKEENQPSQIPRNNNIKTQTQAQIQKQYYSYPNKLGWWPGSTYATGLRLENGQWPKYDDPPFTISWKSNEKPCGPDNPATYGGRNNEGIAVNSWGKIVRRGMCVNGKADCPMGQTAVGARCVGEAARDAYGDLIWSKTEWATPISDIVDRKVEQFRGSEIGTLYD